LGGCGDDAAQPPLADAAPDAPAPPDAPAADAPAPDAGAGPFSSSGDQTFLETETSLAVDGRGGVVAVWIGFRSAGATTIGYAVSRDFGGSWTPAQHVDAPEGRTASDPVVAVDPSGRFFLAFVGFRRDS